MNKTNYLAFLIARLRKTKKSKLSYDPETGRCWYLNKNNYAKCFIGLTLPKKAFTYSDLEDDNAYETLEKNKLIPEVQQDIRHFVMMVQRVHDDFSQTNPARFNWNKINTQFKELCSQLKVEFPSEELIESYKNTTPEQFWEKENELKS